MLFRRFRQFGIEWAIHFWSFFLHPHYPTLPSSTWDSKIFANFLQKMDFLEISYLDVSENLQQYEPILIFGKKIAPRGSYPCPCPPPAH